jgi:hypothetical protein
MAKFKRSKFVEGAAADRVAVELAVGLIQRLELPRVPADASTAECRFQRNQSAILACELFATIRARLEVMAFNQHRGVPGGEIVAIDGGSSAASEGVTKGQRR